MRYAFVKLKNPTTNTFVYMEASEYDRYSKYDNFRNTAVALVIYDFIHIALFPLMFKEDEIFKYNPDAVISIELDIHDICFINHSVSYIGAEFGCYNCGLMCEYEEMR